MYTAVAIVTKRSDGRRAAALRERLRRGAFWTTKELGEQRERESRKAGREKPGLVGRLRPGVVSLLLLGLICLAIVAPLRGVLAPFPALLFLASVTLFMIPGALLSGLIQDEGLSGVARVPVAFVFSVGIFGLSGIPLLLLHRSTDEYLLLCGAILAA